MLPNVVLLFLCYDSRKRCGDKQCVSRLSLVVPGNWLCDVVQCLPSWEGQERLCVKCFGLVLLCCFCETMNNINSNYEYH